MGMCGRKEVIVIDVYNISSCVMNTWSQRPEVSETISMPNTSKDGGCDCSKKYAFWTA